MCEELKMQIGQILVDLANDTIDNKVDLIMEAIQKYESSFSAEFIALKGENEELKEEKKIVIDRNVEMQRKLECINFIIGAGK